MNTLLALVLLAAPAKPPPTRAAAQLAKVEATLKSCLAAETNQNNVGMKECTGAAYHQADQALNALYRQVTATLNQPSKDASLSRDNAETLRRLVLAQRAWVAFRDANSQLAATSMLGGTGEGLVELQSLYEMTCARVRELDALFNGEP